MGNGIASKIRTPRTLFQWVGLAVVASVLLAFWLGTKMLFVAGSIILVAFLVGVVQSAIHMHNTRPRKNAIEGALNLVPHAVILILVFLLLYLVAREFLQAPIQ